MQTIIDTLSQELSLRPEHVQAVVSLLDEGNTIPFIARYRKEQHGTMDDQTIRALSDRLQYLRGLDQRKQEVKAAIAAQDKLTPDIEAAIDAASILTEVEDIYRPFRPKRRTRASIAREKGLEPLAALILSGRDENGAPLSQGVEELCAPYIDADKDVNSPEEALQGAKDILAEGFSDDADTRKRLRENIQRKGSLSCSAATEEDTVYRLYYDFQGRLDKLQSHQVLAMDRGEREDVLKISLLPGEFSPSQVILRKCPTLHPFRAVLEEVAEDAWDRLIFPSLEREIRKALTEQADEQAIRTFALNLRPLLMQPPVKGKVTLGFDPAYRTGCKLAVVDGNSKVLETAVIYPTKPHNKVEESKRVLRRLCDTHSVQCIAIGNGTAGRESEIFVSEFIKEYGHGVSYMVVSEAGASVYSASKLGAEEFPDYDVSLRSAVSIARRLQDPLAELVKIDPKAIGVGQYQHDMPQKRLDEALGNVVEDCVHAVGVDVNTASPSLLQRVAGLNAATAKNVVKYREENGAFTSRKQILKVPKLGPKAYEQCAGFLRVPESRNALDNTAVHPESYPAAEKLLALTGHALSDVSAGKLDGLDGQMKSIGLEKLAAACGVGVPTLTDVARELQKPGRDPRDELPPPILRTDIMEVKDLRPGMVLTGTVRNVIDFGVFVDIGVHQDGLVHISQISRDRFLKHPSEAVSVGDIVKVVVLEVDEKKKRISLSMKQAV